MIRHSASVPGRAQDCGVGLALDGDADGVDIRGQKVAEGVIDQSVARYGAKAGEARRTNPDVIVASAVPGASMTGMQVAFVGDFEKIRGEC